MTSIFSTLRFRIAAAFFFWTGLFVSALVFLLPVARDVYAIGEVDTQLDRLARALAVKAESNGPAEELLTPSHAFVEKATGSVRDYLVYLRREDGQVIATSRETEGFAPPLYPREDGRAHFITSPNPGGPDPLRYRMATQYLPRARQDGLGAIQVGLSMVVHDRVQSAMLWVQVVMLVAGLSGSAIAGWIVSGAVVGRINRVAKAVRQVSPTRLDERIDLPAGTDEIGRMTADVNHMLERMAVAFRSQERFMSEVSHEIKTPLSALLTEAQVLKQTLQVSRQSPVGSNGTVTGSDGHRRDLDAYMRFVLSVEEEMRWLGKLVESFLMLARFGHGKQFITETLVPVNDVVLDAVEHSSLFARQHGVTLSLTLHDPAFNLPEGFVRGDAELLRVVADNLIRNAVQFSKRGDVVAIKLDMETGSAPGAPSSVVLTVKDHGPGVPPEYLDVIFDRFAQAPGPKSTRRGSGLGLTIAKSIADLHGGTIDASNLTEGGCSFRVRLPAVVPKAAPRADAKNPGPGAHAT